MRKFFLAAVCLLASLSRAPAPEAFVSVFYNATLGTWVYEREDATLVTAPSATCQLQEALDYAYPKGLSVAYYGHGQCDIAGTGIVVPAQFGNSFYGYGMHLSFTNTGQNGLFFDTQRYGKWSCQGCSLYYSGQGFAAGAQPAHAPDGKACVDEDTGGWSIDYDFDMGLIQANGGDVAALWLVDVTQCNGVNQLRSSGFTNNTVRFTGLECANNAEYGMRMFTPTNHFQVAGENRYEFNNVEGCKIAEFSIGDSGGAFDVGLGTNIYIGNVAHTASAIGTFGIITDASMDQFILTSLNTYAPGGWQGAVFWGPSAQNNVITTRQAIGWPALQVGNQSNNKLVDQ
ncbi:MAG TPA: hypothetical protein VF748_14780 [Candidatus Acidoferrum sp.]